MLIVALSVKQTWHYREHTSPGTVPMSASCSEVRVKLPLARILVPLSSLRRLRRRSATVRGGGAGMGGQAEVGRPLGEASMCNICTVCHRWGQYGGSGLRGRCAQCGRRGEGDLHVDASAVVGERGLRASLSRGANEQLVRGSDGVC